MEQGLGLGFGNLVGRGWRGKYVYCAELSRIPFIYL